MDSVFPTENSLSKSDLQLLPHAQQVASNSTYASEYASEYASAVAMEEGDLPAHEDNAVPRNRYLNLTQSIGRTNLVGAIILFFHVPHEILLKIWGANKLPTNLIRCHYIQLFFSMKPVVNVPAVRHCERVQIEMSTARWGLKGWGYKDPYDSLLNHGKLFQSRIS